MIKSIPNYPGYKITDGGRIWSEPKPRSSTIGLWLKPHSNKGHMYVDLYIKSKRYRKGIHQLVLETFVGPCPDGMECRHLDGNPANNHLDNLAWGTRSENHLDRVKHGTYIQINTKGEKNGKSNISYQDVRMIIYMYRTGLFTQTEIAKLYDVQSAAVHKIIKKRTWGHIWTR